MAKGAEGEIPIGQSSAMVQIRRLIHQVAPHDTNVLILGESGTGKEVIAREIHNRSGRHKHPFVPINCGAIPADLLESELFGHEKGAFTGALTTRKGRFEVAEGGTLFLDEIGDMSMPMQVKLLRVLQERTFERVGSNHTLRCNVRILAATHRNLEQAIVEGTFREDLYYRLNVFPIEAPPLRQRLDDLPLLVEALTQRHRANGSGGVKLASCALSAMASYRWPGNVRELDNLLERLAIVMPGRAVRAGDLPERYRSNYDPANAETFEVSPLPDVEPTSPVALFAQFEPEPMSIGIPDGGLDLKEHLLEIERRLIMDALERSAGTVAQAARLLGLRRTTLVEKLRKLEISSDI